MFTSGSLIILIRLTVIFFFFFKLPGTSKRETLVGSKMQKFENVGLGGTNENFCS